MSQPKLITKPFADDALPGYVNEIPKENPAGAPEQNASWSVGFPPITMTDIDDGGLPPNGEDMNGVLRAITKHNLFIGGGGVYEFTDDYITEVGGYSKGAVLISDDKTALWMSIQDNNTQNFNGATKSQWRRIAFTELDSTLASIQSALNTKADKSVTITTGDGLTGGGTLAGNRVLAVNSSVVRTDRTITAGTGLSGGGNLSANRTLSVRYGTTAGTAAQGNDSRIVNAFQVDKISQGIGPADDCVMSQKAVTNALNTKVGLTGNQTISGLKTFSQFPVTPSAAPTANYQAANKKYVDDSAIGVGQAWQDVTTLVSENTNRTNTTGRPIEVIISGGREGNPNSQVYIDGILAAMWSGSESDEVSITFTLPNKSHYKIVNIPNVYFFVLELR